MFYQASLRDDIIAWHNTLKKSGSSSDWLIVVVETPDSRQAIIPPHLLTFPLFISLAPRYIPILRQYGALPVFSVVF